MDSKLFYEKLDNFYNASELEQAKAFLLAEREKARDEEDYPSYITICNEMISYYRMVGQQDKAYPVSEDVLLLMEELQMDGSEDFASVLMNSALAYQEGGQMQAAYELYMRALNIYGVLPDCGLGEIGALSSVAEICFRTGDYEKSVHYYGIACEKVKEIYGENEAYEILSKNLSAAKEMLSK